MVLWWVAHGQIRACYPEGWGHTYPIVRKETTPVVGDRDGKAAYRESSLSPLCRCRSSEHMAG